MPVPCAEPENVMVRHAHTPQGLAYRDGSGLACVLADFGSAKMLPPLNAAATELDPHVDHAFAATRLGQLALKGLLAAPASLHPSDAWATSPQQLAIYEALPSTYRHESTRAGPSVPYVCTRPYRAPELFYGSECYRGEPDGARARVRVRGYLLAPVHPPVLPAMQDPARALTHNECTTQPPPCPLPSRSVVPRLLALRHLAAWQHVSKSQGPPM